MLKRLLLNRVECRVDQILQRNLDLSQFRVCPKVRLADAVGKAVGEYLEPQQFSYWSRAHLDFLVTTASYPPEPVFTVEFDGPHHEDPVQKKRDILKNKLCRSARLPLLRLTASEIEEHDKVTVLDYMVHLFSAWQQQKEKYYERWREYVAVEPEDGALSPQFLFSLDHPVPGIQELSDRLMRLYRISWLNQHQGALLVCDTWPTRYGPDLICEEFHTFEIQAKLSPVSAKDKTIFKTLQAVSIRSWLPTEIDMPHGDKLPSLWEDWGTGKAKHIANAWKHRIAGMWFPQIPGLEPLEVAENVAEYLALRAVENWANGLSRFTVFVN